MKIIEGKVKNLRIQKTKYEVLKNNGKQATVSAALGTAVGVIPLKIIELKSRKSNNPVQGDFL
ncbi:hypothetical protein PYR74_05770 [Acinetobacter bereziniae]|nr:hypothetical protein PYR74_05770 [Acinetobacter bereziniae]